MGLQSEPPLHREVIETMIFFTDFFDIIVSEPPLHREVIETVMTLCGYPGYQSEPPLHREVIETHVNKMFEIRMRKCLNHPYTAR